MIQAYNRKSLLLGVPGLGLQVVSIFAGGYFPEPSPVPGVILLAGILLLIAGLMYYAKAKGRNPLWGLLGLFSIIGLICLALLADRARDDRPA